MEAIVSKLIESSVSAALLLVVLWVFLPRLISSIDRLVETNTRQHEAIMMTLVSLQQRLLWHEARLFRVPSASEAEPNERCREAAEFMGLINDQLSELRQDITHLFSQNTGTGR